MSELALNPPTVPVGACFDNWNELAQYLFNNATAELPSSSDLIIVSETEPDADERGKVWFRLVSGRLERVYKYVGGAWRSPHPVPASSNSRLIWVGLAADVDTYDGGSVGAVSAFTGPMWEIDTAFAQRFPVGVGTFPLSGTVVAVGGTGGADEVTLTPEQTATKGHVHEVPWRDNTSGEGSSNNTGSISTASEDDEVEETSAVDDADAEEPISLLPPYIGVYFLKRTARTCYVPS